MNINIDRKKSRVFLSFISLFIFINLSAQNNEHIVRVGDKGKLIWQDTKEEARFWGVNYTVPFAHAFRQIAREGVSHKQAINEDVYHFSRLELNAYRIHVWDCEVSDSIGNLLANEHLDLLDYLIFKLQQRGIYSFITPIAYWGNGYPEKDEDGLKGFSRYYNKGNVYTEPVAIKAQQNYLNQFVNHVNPYTGKAYKDDPMIVGFEVCNEPWHSKPKETEEFVRAMVNTIKATGCTKPVYYNISQKVSLLESYINGGTDGVTFQWYPTGLVSGFMQKGNLLPHVDRYSIPFRNNPAFKNQSRLVYEFDAGDVGQSYMYPAMALSFKEAGMQWASMFAYDPMSIAASNTEYQTHFLNLAYTPQKAIGMKIASELFRNSQYERDRKNETKPFALNGFGINPEKDLAELVTDELFYYTNNTETEVTNISTLKSISGYGNSSLVKYSGCGAYLLDKLESNVWRLEVMPDAVWTRDPFLTVTPQIKNVAIKWSENKMKINLPDLGEDFFIKGISKGNHFKGYAEDGQFIVKPGVYILSEEKMPGNFEDRKLENILVSEFHAPASNIEEMHVVHTPPECVIEGVDFKVNVRFLAPDELDKKLTLLLITDSYWKSPNRVVKFPMQKNGTYNYQASIPPERVKAGWLNYAISVKDNKGVEKIYPGKVEGPVKRWDFFSSEFYTVKVIQKEDEIQFFNAGTEKEFNTFKGSSLLDVKFIPSMVAGNSKMSVGFNKSKSNGWQDKEVVFAFEKYIGDEIELIKSAVGNYSDLKINGQSVGKPVKVKLVLVNKSGQAYSSTLKMHPNKSSYTISLSAFKDGKMMLLPKSYPSFLERWYKSETRRDLNLEELEKMQVIILKEGNGKQPEIELKSITLQK